MIDIPFNYVDVAGIESFPTKDFCVAYKPNIAFYESRGIAGWESLRKTLEYIPKSHFTIADAKRGDIGNTAAMYAETFFQTIPFHSVTVAPYMGKDSVQPFLDWKDKCRYCHCPADKGSKHAPFEPPSDNVLDFESSAGFKSATEYPKCKFSFLAALNQLRESPGLSPCKCISDLSR